MMMEKKGFEKLFAPDVLKRLFPEDRSDQFFDALYGDAEEGAYDISLEFIRAQGNRLEFLLRLTQRPGKCITCSLTHGLPQVFTRHPIINIKGLVQDIEARLDGRGRCVDWKLGSTQEMSNEIHGIPLIIILDN
ncbi:MAG TPA: pancreas/duodenum homeobox protein 1 [Desulfobacterales bacterium]|nr:pancreas/duodenum homeobox protein 1 [Desulfobacterales bacterium]